MEKDKGETMFTTAQTAKRLDVHQRTVQRLYKAGEFPNARRKTTAPSSQILIPLSDIEAFERRRDTAVLS